MILNHNSWTQVLDHHSMFLRITKQPFDYCSARNFDPFLYQKTKLHCLVQLAQYLDQSPVSGCFSRPFFCLFRWILMFFTFIVVVSIWAFPPYRWFIEALVQIIFSVSKFWEQMIHRVFEHLCEDINCFATQAEHVGHCLKLAQSEVWQSFQSWNFNFIPHVVHGALSPTW